MKLLHIIASVDPESGGPIEGILQQCRSPGDREVRHIVCLDPPDAPFLKDFPIRIFPLGGGTFRGGKRSKIARFGFTRRLVPWLRGNAGKYDLVIINGLWSYASVGASLFLPSSSTPYVVYTHGMMDPWFRRTYPLKHWLKQIFWTLFEGRLVRHARAVLFTTEEERLLAHGQFRGYAYRECVVRYGTGDVPDDAKAQIAAFRALLPGLGDRPFLLFLSRIHPKKGCDLLINALAAVAREWPELQLVIAGPDQTGWVVSLRLLAADLGIAERVHWLGMIGGPAKWGAFRAAEAFVLPSHQENFGVAVAEALACGTPVLISDKVNIWREVKAAGGGFVEPDTVAGTKALLDSFLALDQPARNRMRAAARNCFLTNFDLKSCTKALSRTFQELARDVT